jgi:excisionase family DNA binding protein
MRYPHTNQDGDHTHTTIQPQPPPVTIGDGFEPLLDSEEAAALLKIHPKTLQKLARQGVVAAIQIGKLWRFRASALDEWVKRIAG